MLLPYDEAMDFIECYKRVLLEILRSTGGKPSGKMVKDLVKARNQLKDEPQLLAKAIATVNSQGEPLEKALAQTLLTIKIGRWFHLRTTTRYALMLDESLSCAYAVKALTTPLEEVASSRSSSFEAALFEYRGQFICDGLVANPVALGPGLRADLNEAYKQIKEGGRFYQRCAV